MNSRHYMALFVMTATAGAVLLCASVFMRHLNHAHGFGAVGVDAEIRRSAWPIAWNGFTILVLSVFAAFAMRPWKPLTWRTRPAKLLGVYLVYLSCMSGIPVAVAVVTTYIPQMTGKAPIAVSEDMCALMFHRFPVLMWAGIPLIVGWGWFSKDTRAYWAIKKRCDELGLDEWEVCENCGYILTTATCPECGHTNPQFHAKSAARTEASALKRRR